MRRPRKIGAKEDGDDHDETHFTFRVAVFAAAAT